MAKKPIEAEKIFRKFLFRCGVSLVIQIPLIALIIWAVKYSHGALASPAMFWPTKIVALVILALESWLWFWVFTQPMQEFKRLPDEPPPDV